MYAFETVRTQNKNNRPDYNGRKRPQINKHEFHFLFRFHSTRCTFFMCVLYLPSYTNGVIVVVAGRPHE